ncbi:hypothetical protein SAMN02745216_01528 [Desulfatibacillum alkenivorans DSM 16219]|uniref:Uncharacterized protein n=1 Tax=Desulfatibacillum alkenivorans DSM 16219 TaxID=1121393 RepID=A0A1M6IU20_9BACT|nr:hypothetical protein SAMN02745216_01528 [Desulfatibacillum alkenivorans DSM 16219]
MPAGPMDPLGDQKPVYVDFRVKADPNKKIAEGKVLNSLNRRRKHA